jgi:hypothetical protein
MNIKSATFPVYSGFIQVAGSTGGEVLHVAYQGLAASMKNLKVLDNTDVALGTPLPMIMNSSGNPQLNATNYTFADGDFPTLVYR